MKSNLCFCEDKVKNKTVPGYCSKCLGTLADTPKAESSAFKELLNIKTQILESAYQKTLKVVKIFSSSSPNQLSGKDSSEIPEEGEGINKINCLNIESHPNIREKLESPDEHLEKTRKISYKNFVSKHNSRVFSSRLEQSFDTSLLNNSLKDWKSCQLSGHKNSVRSISAIQGKLFSAGSDYRILSWPRPDKFLKSKEIGPMNKTVASSRGINVLSGYSRYLVSAGNHSKIKVWSTGKQLELVSTLTSTDPSTSCLLTNSNFLSAGCTGKVHLWDIDRRAIVRSHPASNKRVKALIEISNSLYISGSSDDASLIDFRCLRNICNYSHFDPVSSLLQNGEFSFYSTADKFRKWDLRQNSVLFSSDCDKVRCMGRVKQTIATGGEFLTIWDKDLPVSFMPYPQINCLSYIPSTDLLYLGCSDGKIILLIPN